MGEFLIEWAGIFLAACFAGNLSVSRGLALSFAAPDRKRFEASARFSLTAVMVIGVTVVAATAHYLVDLQVWKMESPFRVSLIVLFAYVVLGLARGGKTFPDDGVLIAAALAAALLVRRPLSAFAESVVYGIGAGSGVALTALMTAAILERLEFSPVPKWFRGAPLFFLVIAVLSLAFQAFAGFPFAGKFLK